MVKHLLTINDITKNDIDWIFDKAKQLKKAHYAGEDKRLLDRKSLALLFEKPSTRTRVSFEVAMTQLGGQAIDLAGDKMQVFSGRESITDTAEVLARYVDFIAARLYSHQNLLEIARVSNIPVINALTELCHPCQGLTDLFTVQEYFKTLRGKKLVFIGDGNNNVNHSLMHMCYKLGVKMIVCCPKGYEPAKQIINETKNKIVIMNNPREAVKGADVIYTDTWVSMGEEKEAKKRIKIFESYQVNSALMKLANKNAVFMHCLPAHRGEEVTDEVMDSKQSIVYEQAENRLHVQKAILLWLMR